jgi:hypothetical protein
MVRRGKRKVNDGLPGSGKRVGDSKEEFRNGRISRKDSFWKLLEQKRRLPHEENYSGGE